jgi:hypothetical protein
MQEQCYSVNLHNLGSLLIHLLVQPPLLVHLHLVCVGSTSKSEGKKSNEPLTHEVFEIALTFVSIIMPHAWIG